MNEAADNEGRFDVEVLAEEYLNRRAEGHAVSVEEYAIQYPDLADDIREVFPAMEALRSLSSEWKRTVVSEKIHGPELPFQLGEFRLERQIGHGGMGIVYQAEHTNLQRLVAVKLLRPLSLNTSRDIERFHQEARSAAQLHHTNIVPVFDFGQAEGYHYIAMQLIQGSGLDSVVSQLKQSAVFNHVDSSGDPNSQQAGLVYESPTYWKAIAGFGRQAADALDFAHQHGIVHRDIKPANLMLDNQNVLWVADFGLARSTDDGRSQTQSVSGTLRYLAPEHFDGRCDEKSDQYGLALCLYELVTLQPVTGQATNHADIIRRITEAKLTTPRQINHNVPRDLETIILKAMSNSPSDRFSSCSALAEDLQRFVDGQVIKSRPVSSTERLWRWAKRFPALATATATSIALLVLVAVVALLGYQAEREQRQRVQQTSDSALEALETVFEGFALTPSPAEFVNASVPATPVLSGETAELLERLLPIFDRLADIEDRSGNVRAKAAAAQKRVAEIQQRLGQFQSAIDSYQLAIDVYGRLVDTEANESILIMADIYNNIGTCHLMMAQPDSAKEAHTTALQLLKKQSKAKDPEIDFQLARTHFLLTKRLRPGQGQEEVGQGGHSRRPPPGQGPHPDGPPPDGPPPDGPPQGRPPAEGPPFKALGPNGPRRPGRRPEEFDENGPDRGRLPDQPPRQLPPEEIEHLHEAIALLTSGDLKQNADPRAEHLHAICLFHLVPDKFSDRSKADTETETQALEILERLAENYPSLSEYQHSWISTLSSIDTRTPGSIADNKLPIAMRRLSLAAEQGKDLVARHPYVPEYRLTLIHVHNRLGHIFERMSWSRESQDKAGVENDLQNAVEQFRSAARLQKELSRRFPDSTAYESWTYEFERAVSRVEQQLAELSSSHPGSDD